MKSGVCLCVVMAVLAAGALAQPVVPAEATDPVEQRAQEAPRRQLRAVLRTDGEPRARLGALLARYIQQVRKGKGVRSPSGFCCGSNLDPFSTGREEETEDAQGAKFSLFFPEVRCTALSSRQAVFTGEVGGGLTLLVREAG